MSVLFYTNKKTGPFLFRETVLRSSKEAHEVVIEMALRDAHFADKLYYVTLVPYLIILGLFLELLKVSD